jgi:hypothetical protein
MPMSDDKDQIKQLIDEVRSLRAEIQELKRGPRLPGRTSGGGIRKRSETTILGLPLYDIALGPDYDKGEMRGYAHGVIAIGDLATGVVAFGGVACGILSAGGLAIGLLGAAGGAAVGAFAAGGAAIGIVAVGGAAAGLVALGGGTYSVYSWQEFLTKLGLGPN